MDRHVYLPAAPTNGHCVRCGLHRTDPIHVHDINDAARATLERLGYAWNGGAEWKPPIGPTPESIRLSGAVRRGLTLLEAKNYWRDRARKAEALLEALAEEQFDV